jgi:ABC-2 type transport system permease protein
MLFPYLGLTLYLIAIGGYLYPGKLVLYLFFIFNGLIFATAFHILVLAIGIITTTVDHTIMIYRDLTSVGRFPIEIYREPVRFIFTFVFPIALMTNVPAHILMGKNQGNLFAYGLVFSFGLLLISVYLWQLALKKYQSYGG